MEKHWLWITCLWAGIFLALPAGSLQASHLVGGDFTYRCLGKDNTGRNIYNISLNVYRDCRPSPQWPTNTPFDREVRV
ncbi:MAG: hypothetical protein AAFV07_07410, partial [Bacteroidota bacterium]